MRLLSKREIDISKANERKAEIDEGVKLAKRVDSLREAASKEEAALDKFRKETLAQLGLEITSKGSIKSALENEVIQLEYRRSQALIPLIEDKNRLEEEIVRFRKEQESFSRQKSKLSEFQDGLLKRQKSLSLKEKEIELVNKEANEYLQKYSILIDEAQEKLRQSQEVFKNAEREASVIYNTVLERESWVKDREDMATKKEEQLRTKEIELAREFTVLKDRQAMLERDIKRSNK